MAQISISSLHVETIIGTLPEERLKKQTVIISVTFDFDARSAAENDDLTVSVDYSAVERSIVSAVEKSSFLLLEALTDLIGKSVLSFPGISRAEVTVAKPGASAYGAMISYREQFFRQAM